jgi:hypothetical protein
MLNGSVFRGAKATCSVIVISSLAAAAFARAQEEREQSRLLSPRRRWRSAKRTLR